MSTGKAPAKLTAKQVVTATVAVSPKNQQFAAELRALKQPWNWVVRAFMSLLELPDAVNRWKPVVLEYRYSQTPLKDGQWFRPQSNRPEHGPVPLGIVLKSVFEVSIRDTWTQGGEQKQRLIPVAMLGPGAVFGAFEFCDGQASIPALRNYEVSAGSRAFKIVPRNGDSIRKGKFASLESTSIDRKEWKAERADHDALVRYYGLDSGRPDSADATLVWTARILFLTWTPPNQTPEERNLLAVVRNEAWKQSRHLREGHLAWLRHDPRPRDFVSRAHRELPAPASKFVRKLKLASSEECIVFGRASRLKDYGPLPELVKKINDDLGERQEKLSEADVLVPMLLHETGTPTYLSLSDDALELIQGDDFTDVEKAAKKAIELAAAPISSSSCHIEADVKTGGRADPFWRGAAKLTSRFPSLPCLEAFRPELDGKNPFSGCAIVIAQHLLEETGSLIQTLLRIGGQELASRLYVIGKPYSSNVEVWRRIRHLQVRVEDMFYDWTHGEFAKAYREACNALWRTVANELGGVKDIKSVLVLDDGGMLLETVPASVAKSKVVVGVEQTSRGLEAAAKCEFQVVAVAASAAKRRLEPAIVAETVWSKLETILPQACAAQNMALCGLGNVGRELADFLITRFKLRAPTLAPSGRNLWVFDRDPQVLRAFDARDNVFRANNLAQAFEKAEVIFGCAGCDITANILTDLDAIKDRRTRYLVSCSSFDIEFASLLKKATLTPGLSPFDLAQYPKDPDPGDSVFLIPQAGFPITFDRAPCSAPIEHMQMTRGLLLAGLVQAARLADAPSRPKAQKPLVPLDADMQIAVVNAWREAKARSFDDYWFPKRDERQSVERESQPPQIPP